jgi:hypothetical protein
MIGPSSVQVVQHTSTVAQVWKYSSVSNRPHMSACTVKCKNPMCVVCASNHGHHNPITLLLQWWGRSGPCENNHKFSCHGIQALLACVRACMQSYPICTVAVVLDGPVLHCKGSWPPLMHRKGLGFCDLMRLNNTFFLAWLNSTCLGKDQRSAFRKRSTAGSARHDLLFLDKYQVKIGTIFFLGNGKGSINNSVLATQRQRQQRLVLRWCTDGP